MIWMDSAHPPGALGVTCQETARFHAFTACWGPVQAPAESVEVWSMGYDTASNSNEMIGEAMLFCVACKHLHTHGGPGSTPKHLMPSKNWKEDHQQECPHCDCRRFRGLEWVWLMDDDHTFLPQTLMRLLEHNVDVVVPLYIQRRAPFDPCIYKTEVDGGGYHIYHWKDLDGHAGLLDVKSAGKGGVLIRRHVIEKLSSPRYFEWDGVIGEDHTFYRKCREAGFRVCCDLETRLGHVSPVIFTPDCVDGQWVPQVDLHHGATVTLWPSRGEPDP